MENTTELRKELNDLYAEVKAKTIDYKTARSLVSTTNAMLSSAALEMEHSKMVGDKRVIQFLRTP